MVRRTWKYAPEAGLEPWNVAVTVGAFIIAFSILIFMINWFTSRRRGMESGLDPWDARTIEWMSPNPTPEYNFAVPPLVTSLDHFWHLKYVEDPEGRAMRVDGGDEIVAEIEHQQLNPESPIHLPAPSYFPFFFALGLPVMFYGVIYHEAMWGKAMILVGLVVSLAAIIGWAMEPLEEAVSSPEGGGGPEGRRESQDVEEEALSPPSPPVSSPVGGGGAEGGRGGDSAVLPPSGGET
jgi:cytochrome c oxidase subunit 1